MQDKKLKVLLYLGAVWAVLFLVTLRVKAPMLEGVEVMVLVAGLLWLAYWTLSLIRAMLKKQPEQPKAPDAPSQETEQ
jgi:hypothetical protein